MSQEVPNHGEETSPQKLILEILPRWLVVVIAILSLLGAAALCLFAILNPTAIPGQLSRFFMVLFSTFLFALFVFTLYPTKYKIDVSKKIGAAFVLVGPAALWIGLFLFLWYMLPRDDITGN